MELLLELPKKDKENLVEAYSEKARRHFVSFCKYMDKQYQDPPHLQNLINKLEALERGDIKRLMVFMPPRHGKSETISRKFPAWYLGRHPDDNVIMSSYAFTLVRGFSKDVRDAIESRKYKTVFNICTADDARQIKDWDIDGYRGGLLAQGVGGAITGYGAHLFIIDDPFKDREEAESQVIREKVWEWYRNVVLTRLEPNARVILVMTRWHKEDLAGKILAEDPDWEVINYPALALKNDILDRQEGQALWPERYPADVLVKTKNRVGSRAWFALFQGNPQDPESQRFKREWIQLYSELPPACVRGGGIDTATSKQTAADNMALVDVCKAPDKFIYVDDVFCEKLSVKKFAEHVCNQHKIKGYKKIKLESNNAGEAIKQRIDEEALALDMKRHPPIEAVATTTDKVVRASNFEPRIENGTIKFKRGNKKVAELIEHLINFDGKGGDIDDDVDALGFAIEAVDSSSSLAEQEKRREKRAVEEHRPIRTPLVTAKSMGNW